MMHSCQESMQGLLCDLAVSRVPQDQAVIEQVSTLSRDESRCVNQPAGEHPVELSSMRPVWCSYQRCLSGT